MAKSEPGHVIKMKILFILLSILLASPLYAVGPLQAIVGSGGGTGTAAPSWTPLDLTSLVVWYNTPIDTYVNDDPIVTWPDSKGSYNYTTNGTTAVYKTNQQNGLSTAYFSSTGRYYDLGGYTASTYPYTIWVVLRIAD